MITGTLEGWIIYKDGVIDKSCRGAGMIYGLHYFDIDEILEEIFGGVTDFEAWEGADLTDHGTIEFRATNIHKFEGQMSFPETCQWDIPPYWEMEFSIVSNEKHIDIPF